MKKLLLVLILIVIVTPVFAKEKDVESGELYFESAIASLESKKYVDAMKSFNEAIKREPDNIEYYYQRGAMRYKAFKDYPGAIADFKKVIQLNPEYAYAYFALAIAAETENNKGEALKNYKEFLKCRAL